MKDAKAKIDQAIIEAIIIGGQTQRLESLYDHYFLPVHQYLSDHSTNDQAIELLSFFTMRRILLSLPHYKVNEHFLSFAYTCAERTSCDWIAKNDYLSGEVYRNFMLARKSNPETALKSLVLQSIYSTIWENLQQYMFDLPGHTMPSQTIVPNALNLKEKLQVETSDCVLLLMNVWSLISIQYPDQYQENFKYFELKEKHSV